MHLSFTEPLGHRGTVTGCSPTRGSLCHSMAHATETSDSTASTSITHDTAQASLFWGSWTDTGAPSSSPKCSWPFSRLFWEAVPWARMWLSEQICVSICSMVAVTRTLK